MEAKTSGGAGLALPAAAGRWREGLRRLSGRPVAVGVATALAGALFAVLRWAVAAGGNLSRFVVAGSTYVNPRRAPVGLFVGTGNGYDGQFYYRLALDPADMSRRAFGMELDSFARLGRIGYPALSWLLAVGGRPSLVPLALVVANVAGLGALGWAAARVALDSGRHALVGVVVPAYWGYLWSLGRDLTEILAAAALLTGLVALRHRRWIAAAVALSAAVLCKETAAYAVGLVGATQVVVALRRRRRPEWSELAWLVPLVVFGAWELVVRAEVGRLPLRASGGANLGVPLGGLIDGLRHYAGTLPSASSFLWWGELAVLAVVALGAARTLRHSSAPVHERVIWAGSVVLALCVAHGIWLGDVGFRSLDLVYLSSWLVLLGSSYRLRWLLATSAVAWSVVCVELVLFI
ncbi:MAG: hypothetical protein ACYC0E_00965 [Acidimicrobiales bacterium]